MQKKGEELIEHCRNQGNIPVSLEQSLSTFTDRWNSVGALIDDRRHKVQLARRRRDVQDLMAALETVLKDVERVVNKFTPDVPEKEYEMKSQLELCKVGLSPDLEKRVYVSRGYLTRRRIHTKKGELLMVGQIRFLEIFSLDRTWWA